jgi:hypothetical protein
MSESKFSGGHDISPLALRNVENSLFLESLDRKVSQRDIKMCSVWFICFDSLGGHREVKCES